MPRPKRLPDEQILDVAHRLIHREGPAALTFARLSKETGLSGATLVQRFGNKERLIQSTLLRAWDQLDEKTRQLAGEMPKTPEGAVAILVALSGSYGDIETYADGLQVLREDFRDPALRARGAAWKATLSDVLDACFRDVPDAPPGIGLLMMTQWQGALLWWGFDPQDTVSDYVDAALRRFLDATLTER